MSERGTTSDTGRRAQRWRRLVLTLAVLMTAFGAGVLLAHIHEKRARDEALRRAGLAAIPASATDVIVNTNRRSAFCEVVIAFYDTDSAMDRWIAASPGIVPTMIDGEISDRYHDADTRDNQGADVRVDRDSGRVYVVLAFEECP